MGGGGMDAGGGARGHQTPVDGRAGPVHPIPMASPPPPFIIFALPRSRTYWTSRFLSFSGWHCGHEELRHMRSMEDVQAWLTQPRVGTIETGAAPFWRLVPKGVRVATIRRPIGEVLGSLERLGFARTPRLEAQLAAQDRKLDQIEHRLGGLRVECSDLGRCSGAERLAEYCTGENFNPAWYSQLAPQNLQIDFSALLRYAAANAGGIEKLRQIAAARSFASLAREPVPPEGMSFQVEPFDRFFSDAEHLLLAHCETIGERPDSFRTKNLPILRAMDTAGWLVVTTARSNGRMFGYLIAALSPALDALGKLTSIHTAFFADPAVPGLGIKLQRSSIEELRRRGVHEVVFRAGTRGTGPRQGVLYRRLGATPAGETFHLTLREVA